MDKLISRARALAPLLCATLLSGCGLAEGIAGDEVESGESQAAEVQSALTAQDRLNACAQDPRVLAGLVSKEICAGADIFFREAFNGNGRTCASCHPVANNTTIDPPFVSGLLNSNPADPLFVAFNVPELNQLETSDLLGNAGILENVDGFEDPTVKFVVRSVPHVLSMATSIKRDPADGTSATFAERTGWSGDGAPGTGTLREFLAGAIKQHYPKDLGRTPGVSFRDATAQELDLTAQFQLALGRTNELNLQQVNLFDAGANEGKAAFLDPQRGRCNVCHANAGANSSDTGLNTMFDTGNARQPGFGNGVFDGGFGGQGLASPNFDLFNRGVLDSFGDGKFNTPPLIEAADTGPWFHTNGRSGVIEGAISFYSSSDFANSPAGLQLQARFGTPLTITDVDLSRMGRFLRALNGAFNMDIAKQRLQAALTLTNRFQNNHLAVQKRLMELAVVELDDVVEVFTDSAVIQPFYPVAQDRIALAKSEIAAALATSSAATRAGRLSNAISRVQNARDQIGSNITYVLGKGNLMF